MKKYLLSTGLVTTNPIEYILDLFPLYLGVNPGDIPGLPEFGFNFTFAGIPKKDLYSRIEFRMSAFIEKIQSSFPEMKISMGNLRMTTEDTVEVTIQINGSMSDPIYISIYENT